MLSQHVAVYRARHRPAGELAELAESALGSAGRVAVDGRTASLVLSGPRRDVDRALALLSELDRPLRTVLIEHSVEETATLEAAGLEVDWSTSGGSLRTGTLVAEGGGARVRAGGGRSREARSFRGLLRILEGEAGLLLTELRPFDGRFEGGGVRYTAAATALEVEPGGTVVVARTATASDRAAVRIPPGAAAGTTRSQSVLLLRVDLER